MVFEPFLNVERSVNGRRWVLRPADDRRALTISQRLGLPDVIGRILAARNVRPQEAERFLNPTLKDLLPDPSRMKDMDVAAARLAKAVREGETIAVFGDYDVDGATSSALLNRFLTALGAPPVVYIPDRMKEGYGPNIPALLALKDQGARVVVTVDCGVASFAPLAAAAEAGLDIIVIDHHETQSTLPPACAVVNPKRRDDDSPCAHLAAVGVAFLLVVAVNRLLRDEGWYGPDRSEPNLMDWLDIVALGTVCDVAPLVGLNRAFVAVGLKVMARQRNAGVKALAEVAGIKERIGAYHLGYVLGPRINAGGRVGEAGLGARLLSTTNAEEADAFALRLHEYNAARREIEAAVLFEAIEQLESRPGTDAPLAIAAGEGWHPGVIGVVASRLKERYNRPACVIAIDGGEATGSGRSVAGLDLGRAVVAAKEAGLLRAGGGHAMAAGFSLPVDNLTDFKAFLIDRFTRRRGGGDLVPTLELDGAVTLNGVSADFLGLIDRLGPFGAGNEQPRFAIPDVRVARADVVGRGHVRCFLAAPGGGRLKAIAFKCAGDALGDALLGGAGGALHVAGILRLDAWRGRNDCQIVIDDAASVR